MRKEEEAYERYAGELESKLTTVTQFNRTRKWDPESVQAQRDTWVARLEERERRREEQVRERAAVSVRWRSWGESRCVFWVERHCRVGKQQQ